MAQTAELNKTVWPADTLSVFVCLHNVHYPHCFVAYTMVPVIERLTDIAHEIDDPQTEVVLDHMFGNAICR